VSHDWLSALSSLVWKVDISRLTERFAHGREHEDDLWPEFRGRFSLRVSSIPQKGLVGWSLKSGKSGNM